MVNRICPATYIGALLLACTLLMLFVRIAVAIVFDTFTGAFAVFLPSFMQ